MSRDRRLTVTFALCSSRLNRRKGLRADVSKYRPEVYKSEKSKILKKIHKVALGKLLTKMQFLLRSDNYFPRTGALP